MTRRREPAADRFSLLRRRGRDGDGRDDVRMGARPRQAARQPEQVAGLLRRHALLGVHPSRPAPDPGGRSQVRPRRRRLGARADVEAAHGRNNWLVGGGDLVGQFADRGLLDEILVSVAPVTLGAGAPLLPRRLTGQDLRLSNVDHDDYFVFLTYRVGDNHAMSGAADDAPSPRRLRDVHRPDRVDLDSVHTWLSDQSYWAAGRERVVVERSIAGSRPYSVFADGKQVAFARVVTDGATFAWICDVFVDAQHRGQGLGTWLVDSIVADVKAAGVQRLVLATRDAHEVYRRSGFAPLEGVARWMEIDERPTRAAAL